MPTRARLTDRTGMVGVQLAGATNVWAASNGVSASNWTTTAGGAVQALVPSAGTDVTISATSPTTAPTATVLGEDMSIKSLTIADTANGLGLDADGHTLTIGTGGVTMNASVPGSTIAADVILGGDQIWTNSSANTLTASGTVSGAASLTKAGSGTLTLSGVNTYTGKTTVTGGTLSFNSLGNVGGGPSAMGAPTTVADGTIDLAGILRYTGGATSSDRVINLTNSAAGSQINNSGTGTLTLTGGITGGASEIVFRGAGDIVESGLIVNSNGSGALTHTDGGTLFLTNAGNSFTGNLQVKNGTINANSIADSGVNSAIGTGSTIVLGQNNATPDSTFQFSGASGGSSDRAWVLRGGTVASTQTIENTVAGQLLTLSGNVTYTPGTGAPTTTLALAGEGDGLFSGVITGAPAIDLTKSGTGTWTLTGVNTHTGTTNVNGGTLALSGGDNRLPSTGTVSFAGGNDSTATLDIGSTNQTLSTITIPNSLTGSMTANITGSGTLTVNGNTDLKLGPTYVSGTPSTTIDMGGLADFVYDSPTKIFRVGLAGGSPSLGNTTLVSEVTLASGSNTITAASFSVGDQGGGGGGGISKVHLGATNTLNVANINVGSSARSSATMDFAPGLTNPSVIIRNTNGSSAVNSWEVGNVSTYSGAGATGLTWTDTVDFSNGTLDALVGTLSVGQAKAGGSNNRAGVENASFTMGATTGADLTVDTLNIGTISGTNTSGIGPDGIAANGTFTMNNAAGTLNATTINLATNTIADTSANSKAVSGTFNLIDGTLNAATIQKGSQTGTATATTAFNWTGGTIANIAGGDLTISEVPITLVGSDSHTFNISGSNTGTLDATSVISGPGAGITKAGTGTLALSGTNTYTGDTTVTAGTLALSSSTSNNNIGSSETILVGPAATLDVTGISTGGGFQVTNGQTLSGGSTATAGTVTGNTTINPGGTLTGGANGTVGTLSFANNLTAGSGSTWLVDLVQDSNGVSDQIVVAGALDITGANFSHAFSGAYTRDYSYTIASYGSLVGTFSQGGSDWDNNTIRVLDGNEYVINYFGAGNTIILTAVPEPAALLPLAALLLAGSWARRRRSRAGRQ